MHRKNNGHIITLAIAAKHAAVWAMMLALTGALGALLFSLTPSQAASASVRPWWNGHGVWTSSTDPMCLRKYEYKLGVIQVGRKRYVAECLPEGPHGHGPYSWGLVKL